MSYPKLTAPVYTDVLPSTKKQYSYKPFRAKEEKMFLLGLQDVKDDQAKTFALIKNLVDVCTFGKLKNLTTFDVEYVFARIYAKSKGEQIPLTFECQEKLDDGQTMCGRQSPASLNLLHTEVVFPEGFSKRILLDEEQNIGIVMKPLGFSELEQTVIDIKTSKNPVETSFLVIARNIECVFQGEDVFETKDNDLSELVAFLEELSAEQLAKIEAYFESYPSLSLKVDYVCACGKKKGQYTLKGILSFLV